MITNTIVYNPAEMRKVRVWATHKRDSWGVSCYQHRVRVYAPTWDRAYAFALGHACMHHPKEAP